MPNPNNQEKNQVHDFWNHASCGESLYLKGEDHQSYLAQSKKRYALEPQILDFIQFDSYYNQDVLEIGVGLGADHQKFAEAGAKLKGIDLTERAIHHTKKRMQIFGLHSELQIADAENLSYHDNSFDLVYSWGVLHHTPETKKSIAEVFRVLKPGGEAKIMIYHKYSFVGYMLWLKYALLKFKPFTTLAEIYSQYCESPGTKAYSKKEALDLFEKFQSIEIKIALTHGDLLTSNAGQRHKGLFLTLAKLIWPRSIIKRFFKSHGLFMLISGKKLKEYK